MKRLLILLLVLLPGIAAAGQREVIPEKSEIGFTVTQMGVGVSGKFQRFGGSVELDDANPAKSVVQMEVDTASMTTGDKDTDQEARGKAWLDTAGFPKALFKSSSIRKLGDGRYEARGMLDIKGRTRELTVPLQFEEQADGSATATGKFSIRRTDFGIGGGEWNEEDLVANDVPVTFKVALTPAVCPCKGKSGATPDAPRQK
jgi:polyisoprenoid-binding protein YceI